MLILSKADLQRIEAKLDRILRILEQLHLAEDEEAGDTVPSLEGEMAKQKPPGHESL